MRWKLLVLVSLVAGLIASASWFLLIILFFNGSDAIVPLDGGLWPFTLVFPILLATFGGFFVYRHTSRKRKTQAVITVLAVLMLTALAFFVVDLLYSRSHIHPRKLLTHGELTSRSLLLCSTQPDFLLHRLQRVDHEPDVIIKLDTQLFSALINVVTIN